MLAGQPGELAILGAAGEGVIPAAGVEDRSGEALDTGDRGKPRLVQRAEGEHHMLAPQVIAAVGLHAPAVRRAVPPHLGHGRVDQRVAVKVVMLRDRAGVTQDLRAGRVLLPRDVTKLLEQRHVDIGLHVAPHTRVAVPIPDAADVTGGVDEPDPAQPCLAQPGGAHQPAKSGPDDEHVCLIDHRLARFPRRVEVLPVRAERTAHVETRRAIGGEALVPLLPVLAAQALELGLTRPHR